MRGGRGHHGHLERHHGSWTDGTRWSTNPVFPNNNGGDLYDAVINAGAVSLNQNITINRFALGGGSLEGTPALQIFTLTALEGMQWTGGAIRGAGGLALGTAGPTTITGGATPLVLSDRTIDNSGSATFTAGTIRGGSGATLNNLTGATFTVLGNANFFAEVASPAYTINNAGAFIARSPSGAGFTTIDATFNSTGTLRVENAGASHTLSLAGGGTQGGSIDLASNTSLELGGNTTLQGGLNITGAGTVFVAGNVAVSGSISGTNFAVAVGELNVGAQLVSMSGSASQTGGTIRLGSGTMRVGNGLGSLRVDDGTLLGAGTLDASLDTQGITSPGGGIGTLSVTRDATFGIDANLAIEIGGASAGLFDLLAVGDAAVLGGSLDVTLVNGFIPGGSDTFTILTAAGGRTGVFANAPADGARFATTDGAGSFIIDYTPTSVVLTGFIPEPTSCVLLAAGALLLCRRVRCMSAVEQTSNFCLRGGSSGAAEKAKFEVPPLAPLGRNDRGAADRSPHVAARGSVSSSLRAKRKRGGGRSAVEQPLTSAFAAGAGELRLQGSAGAVRPERRRREGGAAKSMESARVTRFDSP